MHPSRLPGLALLLASLTGCAINTTVKPVPATTPLQRLCILHNDDIFMDAFEPLVQQIVREHGLDAPIVHPPLPADCRYRMEYAATWRWDLAMYLQFAEFRLYDGPDKIGEGQYDARLGEMNLGKFGHTEEKIRPVLDGLLGAFGKPKPKPR
jgi:hypothetical protein